LGNDSRLGAQSGVGDATVLARAVVHLSIKK
jgi:hypothetical protein